MIPYSLRQALELNLVPREFMLQAYIVMKWLDSLPMKPTRGIPSRSYKTDTEPSWDNVVRAYEDTV